MEGKKDILLEVKNLKTHFFLDEGTVKAVDGADLTVRHGKTLCVVGESGCGKSMTARSILQLVEKPGHIVEGELLFYPDAKSRNDDAHESEDEESGGGGSRVKTQTSNQAADVVDLAALNPRGKQMRGIRGKEISMIFQEPMTSLSPIHTVGNQIMENILLHLEVSKEEARERAIEELKRVGIPNPEQRVDDYPFQLSGGMRQRAMIAMALSCKPKLLIADEPTTALDVTTQAQILDLMLELQEEMGMAMMFITHDLGVVAEIADNVAVMYLGTVVERGNVDSIFHDPKHPYTRALLNSIPKLGSFREGRQRLESIRGMVPHPYNRPVACPFHTRCEEFMEGICNKIEPPAIQLDGHSPEEIRETRCLLYGGKETGERVDNGKEASY